MASEALNVLCAVGAHPKSTIRRHFTMINCTWDDQPVQNIISFEQTCDECGVKQNVTVLGDDALRLDRFFKILEEQRG
jgi:hypothetical protein